MYNHLSLSKAMYKSRGNIFIRSKSLWNLCTIPFDSCIVVTSQIVAECHLRGRHAKKVIIALARIIRICPLTFAVRFQKSFSIHQICIKACATSNLKNYSPKRVNAVSERAVLCQVLLVLQWCDVVTVVTCCTIIQCVKLGAVRRWCMCVPLLQHL